MEILLLLIGIITITMLILMIQKIKHNNDLVSQNIVEELTKLKIDLNQATGDQKQQIHESIQKVNDRLDSTLRFSSQSAQRQGEQISNLISSITKELTEVKETSKVVANYSAELQELQKIFRNPKQRGVVGEYWLETLLSNILPGKGLYKMQYEVGEEEQSHQKLIADAAIFINDQVIPIDAKFSLENFNRMMGADNTDEREKLEKSFKADVKKRIDETSKYIRPDLGTTNFAFMFIPAEGVYYSLLNAEVGSTVNSLSLIEYAFEKQVMIVSPTSFYAYLQTVVLGLKKLEIEKSTQDIIKRVSELGKHFNMYKDVHERLGKNLRTVVTQYNQSSGEIKKISKDVIRITDGSKDQLIDLEDIEKPSLE